MGPELILELAKPDKECDICKIEASNGEPWLKRWFHSDENHRARVFYKLDSKGLVSWFACSRHENKFNNESFCRDCDKWYQVPYLVKQKVFSTQRHKSRSGNDWVQTNNWTLYRCPTSACNKILQRNRTSSRIPDWF